MDTNNITTYTGDFSSSMSFRSGDCFVQSLLVSFDEPKFIITISNDWGMTEYHFPVVKAMSVVGFVVKLGDVPSTLRDALATFATDSKHISYRKDEKVVTLAS